MRPFSAPALSSPESKSGCLAAKRAAISFDVCFHPGRALHLRGRQRGDTNGLKDLRPPEDGVLFPAELLQLAGGGLTDMGNALTSLPEVKFLKIYQHCLGV